MSIVITTVIILISGLLLFGIIVGIAAFTPRAYTELISDDGEHHIVIAEDCYLFSPYGGDIFEKTSPYTMKKLEKYEANLDFYAPFSNGKYIVTWHQNDVFATTHMVKAIFS